MAAAQALALLRIGLGVEFALWAWTKTQDGWLATGSGLEDVLVSYLPRSEQIYATFLQSFVLPNIDAFARLVTVGEWAVGLTLIFGLRTRLGSLVGMFLMANFALMRGLLDISGSIDHLFFLACLVCLIGSAGNTWGIDALRRARVQGLQRGDGRAAVPNAWANPRAALDGTHSAPNSSSLHSTATIPIRIGWSRYGTLLETVLFARRSRTPAVEDRRI